MTNAIELAALVFRDNGAEFLSTVLRSGPTGRSSVTCGVTTGDDLSLTSFHLNPFDDTYGECAGIDWIGMSYIKERKECELWGSSCPSSVFSEKSPLFRPVFLIVPRHFPSPLLSFLCIMFYCVIKSLRFK